MCVTNYVSSLFLLPLTLGPFFSLLCLIFLAVPSVTVGSQFPSQGSNPWPLQSNLRGPNLRAAGKVPVLHVFPLASLGVNVSGDIWTWLIFMDTVVPQAH